MQSGTPRPEGRLGGVRGVATDWALWVGAGVGARRNARFERILRLAALAFAVAQDAAGDARIYNKGDDAHARAASAEQRVDFEDFSEQARPGAACFPGEVGIVLLGAYVCRRSGAVAIGVGNGDPGPVGIGAVKALAMSSRIGDVGGDAVNPLGGIERKPSGAGARVRGCFHGEGGSWLLLKPWLSRQFKSDWTGGLFALGNLIDLVERVVYEIA